MSQKVLYVIACAAPPTRDIAKFIKIAQSDGWEDRKSVV